MQIEIEETLFKDLIDWSLEFAADLEQDILTDGSDYWTAEEKVALLNRIAKLKEFAERSGTI